MKVIFEKEFLEISERIDNTFEFTNYVIGSRYSNLGTDLKKTLRSLFSGEYLQSDTRKTDSYPMYSIWENSNLSLRVCLDIAEKEKEKLVEPTNEYDFIYCYGKYPDGVEKIAAIIVNINESTGEFSKLDLNINSNLLELFLPKESVFTVKCSMDSDTSFLEGIGIYQGINIFKPFPLEENNVLVSKKSYYKYLRNNKTGGDSSSYLYNNILGEKIYGNSYRKIYKEIALSSLSPTNSISPDGEYIRLIGTVIFDVHKYINNYNPTLYLENGTCDITGVPFIELEVEGNDGISLEFLKDSKKIRIGQNNSGKDLSATVRLIITNLDGDIVKSPELVLIQKG